MYKADDRSLIMLHPSAIIYQAPANVVHAPMVSVRSIFRVWCSVNSCSQDLVPGVNKAESGLRLEFRTKESQLRICAHSSKPGNGRFSDH